MFAGAEADNASISSQAEDECWIKAELCVISRLATSSSSLAQIQAASAAQVHETQHERNAAQPPSAQQIPRRRVWRLSALLVPLHPQLHRRYPCKRQSHVASRRTLHRVRSQPPKRLGGGTTNQDASCGGLRRSDPGHRRGTRADPIRHGRRGKSSRLRPKRTCSGRSLGAWPGHSDSNPFIPFALESIQWLPGR